MQYLLTKEEYENLVPKEKYNTEKDKVKILNKQVLELSGRSCVQETQGDFGYCDFCQHLTTYRDNDNRHPCAQCQSWNRFKIADHIKEDLKDKVNEILKVVNQKEE